MEIPEPIPPIAEGADAGPLTGPGTRRPPRGGGPATGRPRLPPDYVARPRLLRLLDQALTRPLALVSAPAGFGKTTLVSAWSPPGHALVWLGLESDDDLRTVVRRLVDALPASAPNVGADALSVLDLADRPDPAAVAVRLADELGAVGGVVLVLEDYHAVRDAAIHAFVGALLERADADVHLVVMTRVDPPLPLNAPRAQGRLLEIRAGDLAFTADEAREFARRALAGSEAADAVGRLIARCEGWVAGLRLAALALSSAGEGGAPVEAAWRGGQYAREFVIHEVFAAQPPDVQDLLLRSSILDRFSGPLLDALYDPEERPAAGSGALAALTRANLFLTALDHGGVWYRYHRLFRDALVRELEARYDEASVAALHRRAGTWFAERGMVRPAVRHALRGGAVEQAARLVEQQVDPLLDREGAPGILDGWLRLLPAEVVERRPALLLARCWLLVLRYQLGDLPETLRRVDSLLEADADLDGARREELRGTADLMWAYAWGSRSDAGRFRASVEAALRRIPTARLAARGHAEQLAVAESSMAGRDEATLAWIGRVRGTMTPADGARLGTLLRAEGYHHLAYLRPARAAAIAGELAALGEARSLPITRTWGRCLAGLAAYARDDVEGALASFRAGVAERAHTGTFIALECVLGLAVAQHAAGDGPGALATLGRMASLLESMGSHGPLWYVRSCAARLALARGDLDEAGRQLRMLDAREPPAFTSFVEAPAVTRARWLLAQGTEEALRSVDEIVRELRRVAELRGQPLRRLRAESVAALALDAHGDADGALAALRGVLAMAEPGELIRHVVDLGPPMQRLLVALERDTPTPSPYLRRVLAAFPTSAEGEGRAASPRAAPPAPIAGLLTERELEIVRLIDARMSNREIARLLRISPETVKKHTAQIYEKLRVTGRRAAAARARQLGLA